MRWTPGDESQDIEDRRDESGGGGGFRFGGMHIGIGGAITLLVLSLIFKQNFFALLGGGSVRPALPTSAPNPSRNAAERPLVQFVSFVLDDTRTLGRRFFRSKRAGLIITPNWCSSAITPNLRGVPLNPLRVPFTVPATKRCTSTSASTMSSSGASVHRANSPRPTFSPTRLATMSKNILGIERRVQGNSHGKNSASVHLELEADCLAGVWARSTQQRGLLEKGDVESALGAAAAVGDDRLQKWPPATWPPDSFTHGTSQQRMSWFGKGLDSGSIAAATRSISNNYEPGPVFVVFENTSEE